MPTPNIVISSNTLQNFIIPGPGPVNYHGRRYVLLDVEANPSSSVDSLGIAMSTDGVSWVVQDASNQPTNINGFVYVGWFYPKTGGNAIWLAFSVNATHSLPGPIHLRSFNMDTNTWGTDIPGGPNSTNSITFVFQLSNTDLVVIYQTGASNATAAWVIYSSGSWGSPTNIPLTAPTSAHSFVDSALVDPNDRVHMVIQYQDSGFSNLTNAWYSNIHAGSATTPVDTGTLLGQTANYGYGYGDYDVADDSVGFPTSYSTPKISLLRIKPSTAPTSFALETVNTAQAGSISTPDQVRFCMSPDGTQELCTWLNSDFSHLNLTQIWYALKPAGSGTWSAAVLVWNYVANPPQPPPPTDGVEAVWFASWSSDGILGYVLGGFATSGGTPYCDIAYYLSIVLAPPSNPLTLACPVNNTGTIGVPYSGQLIASGGTPPYTYSIIS